MAEAPITAPVAPAPSAALPLETAPIETAPVQDAGTRSFLPWIIGAAGLLLLGLAFLMMRRRRRDEEEYLEVYEEAPVAQTIATPPMAEPAPYVAPLITPADIRDRQPVLETAETTQSIDATASVENVSISEPASEDVEAIVASSEPVANRPWIEFMLRPIRAGTTSDDAVVEFELTVGNTGSVAARDVKVSTWMFAAGSAQDSEMEQMLINPPADARVSESTIEPGDGTRVEASISLPKTGLEEMVLPVVVADARYRLADGSEGRTSASFAIGMVAEGETLAPFPTDRASGLIDSVEARLHGDLQRK